MKHIYLLAVLLIDMSYSSAQWVQTKGPYIGRTTAMITVGNNIYACNRDWGNSDGRIYRSSNFGMDWTGADNGITPQFASVSQFAHIGETILAAANRLYRTVNQGNNWEIKESGLFAQAISLMATQDTFWAGTSGGGVFRSTNLGESWVPMNNGLTGTVIVYDMYELNGFLFLATEGGGGPARLYRSDNRGLSWQLANSGLPLGTNPIILPLTVTVCS